MENLAPAGNRAALERADAAGADAVYLGYTAFSARAGAGNFSREELQEAIRYAHLRHMRVHVTVNTLVKDGELAEALEVLRMLWSLQADAVLIQDLGLLRLVRKACPDLAVHASTQMAIHNRTGVAWCRRQGIRRVVLARECSLEEIRQCCELPVEIEVFGHGAQCVAVSGLCLFSSMLGERSGNRGRCAQPCRMEYTYRGKRGAWLSPRDVCLRDDLPALKEAGAVSVKLEGRLKRPEYAGVVAESYHRGLESLEAGCFRQADAAEREGLLQIFHRGDFMRGYAFGCEDAGVIDPLHVNHGGLEIGRVEECGGNRARLRLSRDLYDGDGLCIRRGRESGEMIYAGKDCPAGETAFLRLREGIRAKAGDPVFRLTDARQLADINARPGRTIPADARLRAMPGEKLRLCLTDGESTVEVTGEEAAEARTRALTPEELERNLRKTGDTPFVLRDVRIETENAFVPVSAVNRLRREALEKLAEARIAAFAPDRAADNGKETAVETDLPAGDLPPMAIVRTREQGEAARKQGLRVIHFPEDYREDALRALLEEMPAGDWLRLPDVCEEETLGEIHRLVTEYREKIGGVLLGTVGQLGRTWPVPVAAGSGIPVMNRQAARLLLEEGCVFVTASPELTGGELRTLMRGNPPIVMPVYGRTQLMLLHHCPERTARGLSRGHRTCRLCEEAGDEGLRGQVLEDRLGYRFPLLRQRLPEGCLVRLMNALPTGLTDQRGIPWRMAEFTVESPEETAEILEHFASGTKTEAEATTGHWRRPVE